MPPFDQQDIPAQQLDAPPESQLFKNTAVSDMLLQTAGLYSFKPQPVAPRPAEEQKETSVALRQTAADFAGSLTAGVSGVVAFSLLNATTHGAAKAMSVPLAMLAGGATKYTVKSGVEHTLLDEKHRTTNASDFAWGAVDGLAGVAGSAVDQQISRRYLSSIGRKALGSNISNETALEGAKVLIQNSGIEAIKHNVVRGLAGGAAGTFVWSAPRRVWENREQFATNPGEALASTAGQMTQDVAFGSLFGGALTGTGTALFRGRQIAGEIGAKFKSDANVMRIDGRFMGDFHSNLDQLPYMKTALDKLNAQSHVKGTPTSFDITGDALSGHVNFAFTKGGQVEYETLIDMQARKIILGNHEHDAAGGLFDVPRWGKVMRPILEKNPNVSVINSNLDVSAYPEYQGLTKPYVVEEIMAPWGKTKVATIGITTEEGAVGAIKYHDAEQTAIAAIKDLNSQGIKHIVLDTHIGLGEDLKLARALIRENLKVSRIQGGHSHSITPMPIWVGPEKGVVARTIDRMMGRPVGGEFEIPIMHAGSGGRWLGNFQSAVNFDGTANRYFTRGNLVAITPELGADEVVAQAIKNALPERNALTQETYGAIAVGNYSARGLRAKETALGNLVSDAIRSGLKPQLGDDLVVMTHSGGIRDQIVAGKPLTRLDIANLVMNAGKREGEIKELVNVRLTGAQIKQGLEYGVRDLHTPVKPTVPQRFGQLFFPKAEETAQDLSGNFVQVSGLKYSIDLSGEPWKAGTLGGRINNVKIQAADGSFSPIEMDKTYNVVTRQHPVHKWTKAGLFGSERPFEDVAREIQMQPVPVSQVDLIAQYISGKQIDPKSFSAVEGRITNNTQTVRKLPVKVGVSVVAQPSARTVEDNMERE
ncbi:MAG TPA: 5'-nucleotidase C-terminal domain-containing protein [Candidatus Melainabacteria bacterium]|nr:5'-nucleotidase C-terminal domain-containing protein [Candidatus Melainabacteria bacterium]